MRVHERICVLLSCLAMAMFAANALAADNAELISSTVTNGAPVTPKDIYTQTWTFLNTGTTTWEATSAGYTLNLISEDSLGVMQLFTNVGGWYVVSAVINGGKNIAPGQEGSFSVQFIAPEAAGSYTDSFSLNNTGGTNFGPTVTLDVAVQPGGNTNVFDRSRAISFANNYAAYYCPDGYFWTNGGDWSTVTPDTFTAVPTGAAVAGDVGDDCAHFVSYCIGSGPYVRGGGMKVPSRVPPTYGEPGAPEMINNILLDPGYGVEVQSISQLEPGDVIGWNWEGDTNIEDIDHVTLYLGNNLLASHSISALAVDPYYFQEGINWKWHLIHILDFPTLWTSHSGRDMTFSWTTNWNNYALYSASNLTGPWAKVTTTPHVTGITNSMTLIMPASGPAFYRLEMP